MIGLVELLLHEKHITRLGKIKHCEWCSHKFTEGEEKHPYDREGKRTRYICSVCAKRLEGE